MIVFPSETARDAAAQRLSIALFSAPIPRRGMNRLGSVTDLIGPSLDARILAISALVSSGRWSLSCLHCSGVNSNRLPSEPTNDSTDVTSSSRMASSGGLLT